MCLIGEIASVRGYVNGRDIDEVVLDKKIASVPFGSSRNDGDLP